MFVKKIMYFAVNSSKQYTCEMILKKMTECFFNFGFFPTNFSKIVFIQVIQAEINGAIITIRSFSMHAMSPV